MRHNGVTERNEMKEFPNLSHYLQTKNNWCYSQWESREFIAVSRTNQLREGERKWARERESEKEGRGGGEERKRVLEFSERNSIKFNSSHWGYRPSALYSKISPQLHKETGPLYVLPHHPHIYIQGHKETSSLPLVFFKSPDSIIALSMESWGHLCNDKEFGINSEH